MQIRKDDLRNLITKMSEHHEDLKTLDEHIVAHKFGEAAELRQHIYDSLFNEVVV